MVELVMYNEVAVLLVIKLLEATKLTIVEFVTDTFVELMLPVVRFVSNKLVMVPFVDVKFVGFNILVVSEATVIAPATNDPNVVVPLTLRDVTFVDASCVAPTTLRDATVTEPPTASVLPILAVPATTNDGTCNTLVSVKLVLVIFVKIAFSVVELVTNRLVDVRFVMVAELLSKLASVEFASEIKLLKLPTPPETVP